MRSPKFGLRILAVLSLVVGCGISLRVPFVGVGVRVLNDDMSPEGDERVVTTYIHNGKTDRLEVYRGRIKLNDIDHGPVEAGDQVALTEDQLLVNGNPREPVVGNRGKQLPPPTSER